MQSQTQMRLQLVGVLRSHTHTHSDNVPRSHHFRVARQGKAHLETRLPLARPLSRDAHPRAAAWRPCPGLQTFSPARAGRKIEELNSLRVDAAHQNPLAFPTRRSSDLQTQMRLQLVGVLRSHTHTHSDNVPRSHHFRVE